MTAPATTNVHASAIVVDGLGFVFVGPSGSGKSALAFDCLAEARQLGLEAQLISDDQLLIRADAVGIWGRAPETIRGLLELRYGGIIHVPSIEEALLHAAVMLVPALEAERLPPDNEVFSLTKELALPLLRVPSWSRNPLSLIVALSRNRISFDA